MRVCHRGPNGAKAYSRGLTPTAAERPPTFPSPEGATLSPLVHALALHLTSPRWGFNLSYWLRFRRLTPTALPRGPYGTIRTPSTPWVDTHGRHHCSLSVGSHP